MPETSPEKRARLREDIRVIARVITSFAQRLPPVEKLEFSEHKIEDSNSNTMVYLTSHALAHSAMSALHEVGASLGEPTAINASLTHATEVVKIVEKCCRNETRHLTVCPILAVSRERFSPLAIICANDRRKMLGESAAQIFLGEEERLIRSLPTDDISALPQAQQSRIAAARSNVQRIIDAFRLVDAWNSPIFGERVLPMLDRMSSKLMNSTSPTSDNSTKARKRKLSNDALNDDVRGVRRRRR